MHDDDRPVDPCDDTDEQDTEQDTEDEASNSHEQPQDVTAWRAREEADTDEEDDVELDDRVEGAFDSLNEAIARNNEVEAAYVEAQKQLETQKQNGEAVLASLEKQHAKQLRKLDKFRLDQAKAQEAAAKLRRLSTELQSAREVLELTSEALALGGQAASEASSAGHEAWTEAQAKLRDQHAAASHNVKRLAAERRKCAADAERRARRLVARSAVVGDVAAEALPYLARQASLEYKQSTLEERVRQQGEETARAKATVKEAMGDLEKLSLDIMRQHQEQHSQPQWQESEQAQS